LDASQIIWKRKDRYAIIAFLLLSVDKGIATDCIKKLDAFMGIDNGDAVSGEKEGNRQKKLQIVRDTIVREGNAFLKNVSSHENGHIDQDDFNQSRYDAIINEIECVIEGKGKCGIGDGYAKNKKLSGSAYLLFKYVKLVDENVSTQLNQNDCSKAGISRNTERILKHLALKWDIDNTVLPILLTQAATLIDIYRKRKEIQNSKMPHNEAISALAKLDAREKTVWEELGKLHIDKSPADSIKKTALTTGCILTLSAPLLSGIAKSLVDDGDEDDDSKKNTLSDKIGDFLADGVYKIGDLICTPFDWMTEKIINLM
jgi:hypothetical protein